MLAIYYNTSITCGHMFSSCAVEYSHLLNSVKQRTIEEADMKSMRLFDNTCVIEYSIYGTDD